MNVVVSVTKDGKTVEKFMADYPNIRTLRGFLAGQWNLAPFDNCFKGRNRLGDVDASIELNGHTLLIEFKGAKNGMNKGQVLKAIRQAKYSNITTMFVFGKRDTPEAHLTIEPDADAPKGYTCSGYVEADFKAVCEQFTLWANKTEENILVESKSDEWNEVSEILGALYQ
jgi:hypothetical protein